MILELFPVLGSVSGLLWGLVGFLIFFLALVLIVVILLQDSKDGGLGGAFGGAGGGGELLGARGQKEIVRFTTIVAIVLFGLIIGWGAIEARNTDEGVQR